MRKPQDRAAATRTRLIAAARESFARVGYAETATEAILEAAGVKRGALYHHFADKAAVFEAVCEEVIAEAAEAVEAAATASKDPLGALKSGARAWVRWMAGAEARQILILDAPTVLGWARWEALDRRHAYALLKAGLGEAMEAGAIHFPPGLAPLTAVVNGALNAIALRYAEETPEIWDAAIDALFESFAARG